MKRRIGSYFYKSGPRKSEITKARWNIWRIIGSTIRKTCTVIGAVILFFCVMTVLSVATFEGKKKAILPNDMILVLNMTDPIGETEHARSLADPFAAAGITIGDLIATIDRASIDPRVRGLLVSLDSGGMELAHIEELRVAIKRLRASGKFAHIYTASFADTGSGIGGYYLATAFDEIWMQPVGMLNITGISMQIPYARAALDKIGANPEFLHREEYKSAMEPFTNERMSEPTREMMHSILESLSAQIAKDIMIDRKMPASILEANLNKGLVTGKDAVKAGLITRLDYSDVLVDEVQKRMANKQDDKDLPLIALEDYFASLGPGALGKGPQVALVRIAGEIIPGADPEPGFATSDYIADAIDEAAKDEDIKAIVVRVNSPGGSPTASETIRRAIAKAKENGKKIIVSMGPLAASGGYWVSVDADKIYAMPTTLTGSIGVIMGKFEVSKMWEKIGINWSTMSWGENAGLWSSNKPLKESERAVLEEAIDDTYASFIERVAKGRKMDPVKVREIAKGRAWTGLQAKQNGLVDDLGGLDAALDYTASLVGMRDRTQLDIHIIPEPLTPLEQFMHMMGQQVFFRQFLQDTMIGDMLRRVETVERSGIAQTYEPDLRLR